MADEQVLTKPEEVYTDESLKELIDAGVFYGRKKSKTHPRMKQFILSNRNGIELINLEKTKEQLEAAMNFLSSKVGQGAKVLFVATQPPAAGVVALASEFGYPYVDRRWLGGTLTNLRVITGRLDYFRKLKNDVEKNLLDKYTKKERLGLEKELERMKEVMTGLEVLHGMPDLMVVIDPNLHATAVAEAKHMKVPVIAFMNTDSDPDGVEFPVVGNNKATTSINWFLEKVREAVKASKTAAAAKQDAPAQ